MTSIEDLPRLKSADQSDWLKSNGISEGTIQLSGISIPVRNKECKCLQVFCMKKSLSCPLCKRGGELVLDERIYEYLQSDEGKHAKSVTLSELTTFYQDNLQLDLLVDNLDQVGKMSIVESHKLLKKASKRCISLICSISNKPIKIPVRTIECTHAEVFCLESVKSRKKAKCPYCGKKAKLKTLTIDPTIQSFITQNQDSTIARVVKESKKQYKLEVVDDINDVIPSLPKQNTTDFLISERADVENDFKISLMFKGQKILRPARGKNLFLLLVK